jgi:hypothetical protein
MKLEKKPVVVADLPRAGLGNILFVWAKALIFSRLNDLPLEIIGWDKFKLGPWLRGERSKRDYTDFFQNQIFSLEKFRLELDIKLAPKSKKFFNPLLESSYNREELSNYKFIIFNQIPHWSSYFEGIREHRDLVKSAINDMLQPSLRNRLDECTPPMIGVHVRLGDFRPIREDEDFREVGGVRTPLQYFIETIDRLRKIHKDDLSVMVFTDGRAEEIEQLLNLPNVSLAPKNLDIVDMLLLSRSKVVVTSAGSTFGYWAGFLADAPLIMHPDHIHESIRSSRFNKTFFEGAIEDFVSPILVRNMCEIICAS